MENLKENDLMAKRIDKVLKKLYKQVGINSYAPGSLQHKIHIIKDEVYLKLEEYDEADEEYEDVDSDYIVSLYYKEYVPHNLIFSGLDLNNIVIDDYSDYCICARVIYNGPVAWRIGSEAVRSIQLLVLNNIDTNNKDFMKFKMLQDL